MRKVTSMRKQNKFVNFVIKHFVPLSILVFLFFGLSIYIIQSSSLKIITRANPKSAEELGFTTDYSVRLLNSDIDFKFLPNAVVKTQEQVDLESCEWYQKQYEHNASRGVVGGWISTQNDVNEACAAAKRQDIDCEMFDSAKITWRDINGLNHDFMVKYYSSTCGGLRNSSVNARYAMPTSVASIKRLSPAGKVHRVQQRDIGEIVTYEQAMTACTNGCTETDPNIYSIIILKPEIDRNMIIQILPFRKDDWATGIAESIRVER